MVRLVAFDIMTVMKNVAAIVAWLTQHWQWLMSGNRINMLNCCRWTCHWLSRSCINRDMVCCRRRLSTRSATGHYLLPLSHSVLVTESILQRHVVREPDPRVLKCWYEEVDETQFQMKPIFMKAYFICFQKKFPGHFQLVAFAVNFLPFYFPDP